MSGNKEKIPLLGSAPGHTEGGQAEETNRGGPELDT